MPLDTTGLCGEHWNKEPSRTTRNSQRRIQEGIGESKVEPEETDDADATATASTVTGTGITTMTGATPVTKHGPQIKHFVETILRQKQDSFVDLAVWKWIGLDSTATFAELLESVDSEQTFEAIDFDDTTGTYVLLAKARGQYIRLLKGIKYGKH